MVWNKLCFGANNTVGLSKQRKVWPDWYKFLCFVSATALHVFASQHNFFPYHVARLCKGPIVYFSLLFADNRLDASVLPKQVDCEFKDKSNSWLWRQTLTISVTWLCLANRKAERTWSHSFLLGDFAFPACCSQFGVSESTIFMEAPNSSTESFLYHSAMMEPKMFPLKLSCMDFPQI